MQKMFIASTKQLLLVFLLFSIKECASAIMALPGDRIQLECKLGSPVRFEIPCPGQLDSCRFRKLFRPWTYVHARDGPVGDESRGFEVDDRVGAGGISLRSCSRDDERSYSWLCDGCKRSGQFLLRVSDDDESSTDFILDESPGTRKPFLPENPFILPAILLLLSLVVMIIVLLSRIIIRTTSSPAEKEKDVAAKC